MKEDVAIRVSNVSKRYTRSGEDGQKHDFLALKNVSFKLEAGEVLGIIGSNGSGKSTLLRVLSGITKPTEGKVELYGDVASILDIGTGFHPDLSGRANIFLRGQMLGMSKKEIREVYDELLEFSGVKDFIDTPVKHYSSGMFLRLAFSIIVHLKFDILLLDEVMAVGDVGFKEKCDRKIEQVVSSGKTVVLVSHDMKSVLDRATKVMLLKKGEVVAYDEPFKVVGESYLPQSNGSEKQSDEKDNQNKWTVKSLDYDLEEVSTFCLDKEANNQSSFSEDVPIGVRLVYRNDQPNVHFGIIICDFLSNRLIDDSPKYYEWKVTKDFVGRFEACWVVPKSLLNPGRYYIDVFIFDDQMRGIKRYPKAAEFEILGNDKLTGTKRYYAPIAAKLSLRFNLLP